MSKSSGTSTKSPATTTESAKPSGSGPDIRQLQQRDLAEGKFPGEAKSDLDILLDFAKRMKFQDRDGKPLVKWKDAEGAFKHWARCSRGSPDASRF